ncbi:hypothetical protein [endosymbiont of Lamellibrachia barhami]|uniref:hypothetical protein n=1 Tax=endosymbiont of Lamellibrachia barhami TaxID=205975 RepID=UPI001FE413A3|nr:hypothetical protein [endosymbiont of Lamellibrachia barhami]
MGYKEIFPAACTALDKVGLLNKEKAAPITLSGGEQQRSRHRPRGEASSSLISSSRLGGVGAESPFMIMRALRSSFSVEQ